jgi:hypothetical protein
MCNPLWIEAEVRAAGDGDWAGEFRVSPYRKMSWLRRLIVRAIPTCTLWRQDDYLPRWRFVLWPSLVVGREEIEEA